MTTNDPWTDMPSLDVLARDAVLLLACRGSFPVGHLVKQAALLRMEHRQLVSAAWDLVEEGALTYDATAIFAPANPADPTPESVTGGASGGAS
jgi:hypothetical protein